MGKQILVFVAGIWIAVFAGGIFVHRIVQSRGAQIKTNAPMENQIRKQSATLLFLGDIMLDRGVELQMKKHNDWRWPFLNVAEKLKKFDLVFANLESPISDKGVKVGSIYSFRANPATIQGLSYANIGVLSFANNHSFDYGRKALADTIGRLLEAGIGVAGAGDNAKAAHAPYIREIAGTKIAILAYTNLGPSVWQATDAKPGIAWIDEHDLNGAINDIRRTKTLADVVVVSVHAGEEYQTEPTAFQTTFAREAIGAGADLVIEHHSHVVQRVERYGNGWIAYGLGNFIFDQSFSEETMRGLALKVTVADKKITQAAPLATTLSPSFQAEIMGE